MRRSRVIKARDGGPDWAEVPVRPYKDHPGTFEGVVRRELLGPGPEGDHLNFQVRYFEVAPGGYSSLERHAHPHAVVVVRGRGRVRLGAHTEPIGPFDVVYVAPREVHRFEADPEEPLGFLCVVDRERDAPELVREDDP